MLTRAVLAVLAGVISVGTGHAPAVSFAVSPTRIEVTASGPAVTRVFRVENTGRQPLTITGTVRQGHQLASGASVFTAPGPDSGAGWLTIQPDTFRLGHDQIQPVRVTIRVPANHAPGQHYLGILFSAPPAAPASHQTGATVSVGVDAEIILQTSGTAVHKVALTLSAPAFSWGGSIPLRLTLTNNGNVYALDNHLAATSGNSQIPFPGVLTLAGSMRVVGTSWTSPPAWCMPCTIHLGNASARVWRISLLPTGGVLLIILGASVALLLRRKGTGTRARPRGGPPRHASQTP